MNRRHYPHILDGDYSTNEISYVDALARLQRAYKQILEIEQRVSILEKRLDLLVQQNG